MEATPSGAEPITSSNGIKKIPRQRSAAYPSYPIPSCVKVTEKIDNEFTSARFIPKDDISRAIGSSGGAFLQQLSSCVQYGLLELKSKEGYKPSSLFKKIQKPLPHENVNDSLTECFKNPELYKTLIAEYNDKQLPSEKGLVNILERNFGIVRGGALLASKIFFRNAIALNLIADGNILKIDTYIPFVEEKEGEGGNLADKPPIFLPLSAPERKPPPPPSANVKEIPIFLKGKGEAKVVLPEDFDENDLRRIVNVLNGYLA